MFGGFQLRAECPKLPSCRCCREAASREPCSTDVWEKLFQIWRQRTRTSPKIGPRKCTNKTLTNTRWHSVTLGDSQWHSVTLGDTRWHSVTLSNTKRDKILEIWVTQIINIKMVLRDASASIHCQRHNGPEGWVHITSSCTNVDQISISESRLSINFNISSVSRLNLNLDSTL